MSAVRAHDLPAFDMLAIADAVTGLSLEPACFSSSMAKALACLRKVFEFQCVYLVRLNPANWSVGGIYAEEEAEDEVTPIVQDFASELRLTNGAFLDLTFWRYSPHPPCGCAVLRHDPIAVASVVLQQKQAVMLVGECRPSNGNIAVDPQILHATTRLLARAIERHAGAVELDERRQRLEERLRFEAVSNFANGIAHEFNNLLAAITGYAEMAAGALDPRSTSRDYVDGISEAAARALQVTEQIRSFSRSRCNLAEPMEVVTAIYEALPALYVSVAQGVHLRAELPDPPLVMAGGSSELTQILANLCKNAGEALQGKGEVTLSVEPIVVQAPRFLSHGRLMPGQYVRIVVNDNGPGIAAEHVSRIFEPFFTTKADSGAGLGLFVVLGAVQSLNGAMHVSSILGQGACFELFFPRLEDEELPVWLSNELPGVHLGNGELVAIVDPVEASRSRWEEKLAVVGYEPVAFLTMQALSDWCYRTGSKPDVVLLDVQGRGNIVGNMEIAALSEARWIYACEESALLPTGWRATDTQMVLRKPVSQEILAGALMGALESSVA